MPLNLIFERIALVAMLLVTPALLDTRALADVLFSVTGLLFLIDCARTRRWGWLRQGWVPFAGAWWMWEMICSLAAAGCPHARLAALGRAGGGGLYRHPMPLPIRDRP